MLYEHADCEEVQSFIIVYVIKCNHDGIEHVCYEHADCEEVRSLAGTKLHNCAQLCTIVHNHTKMHNMSKRVKTHSK